MNESYYRGFWDPPRVELELTNSGQLADVNYQWDAKYGGANDALYQDGLGMSNVK